MRRFVSLCLLLLGCLAYLAQPAAAERRFALVVGIDDYPKLPQSMQLQMAVADAETMSNTLRSLGFDVELARNVDRAGFLTALDRVRRKVSSGDTVFVFFAGHGVALKGSNLLLPADIPAGAAGNEILLRGQAIAETDIISALREKQVGLTVLALDACRNNPIEELARERARIEGRAFRTFGGMRSVGLDTRSIQGVFSIYSAGLGQRALDRLSDDASERNSVFTRVFARMLRKPGIDLTNIMEDVKVEVARLAATVIDPDTGQPHRQYPAYYNEIQGGRIYLAGRSIGVEPSRPKAPPPRQDSAKVPDLIKKMKELEDRLKQTVRPPGSKSEGDTAFVIPLKRPDLATDLDDPIPASMIRGVYELLEKSKLWPDKDPADVGNMRRVRSFFSPAFAELLKRNAKCMDDFTGSQIWVEGSDYQINDLAIRVSDKTANTQTVMAIFRNFDAPQLWEYKFRKTGGRWLVHDIRLNGKSLTPIIKACGKSASGSTGAGGAWWEERVCSPSSPGPRILRSANIKDLHRDWSQGFIGDSWNLIRVKDIAGGYLSGCLLSPRASVNHDGLCKSRDRVYVAARQWTCR